MFQKFHAHLNRSYTVVKRHAKNHFIPHPGNGHLPRILHHRTLIGASMLSIILKGLLLAAPILLPSTSVYSSALTPKNIVQLTNQTRRDLQISELRWNILLAQAAQAKAEDMLQSQYFAHTSPTGRTPWSWIKDAGYHYGVAAENLAVHYITAEQVQNGWLLSESHRANIIDPRFTEIGVAVVEGQFEGTSSMLVVQLFGNPLSNTADTSSTTQQTVVLDPNQIRVLFEHGTYSAQFSTQSSATDSQRIEKIPLQHTPNTQTIRPEFSGKNEHGASDKRQALTLITRGLQGSLLTKIIAWFVPAAQASEIYNFTQNGTPPFRLFGIIPVLSLQDNVYRVYIGTIVVLGSCLVGVLICRKSHRRSIAGRTLAVIGLIIVLLIL